MASTDPREDMLKTYASKFGDAEGDKIIDDLVITAQQIAESGVRVGFTDAILVILRKRSRGKELARPASVRGSARLRNTGPGLINQGDEE